MHMRARTHTHTTVDVEISMKVWENNALPSFKQP